MTPFPSIRRRRCLGLLAGGAAALAAGCAATPDGPPEEGFEYRAVPQQPARAAGPQEVIEFFWYGCPHCNALEPLLTQWRRDLPADVGFRKVHVGFGERWVPHQQMFYALTALGRADEFGDRIFRALHVDGTNLDDRDRMADFLARSGLDRARFIAAFDSPAVRTEMTRAGELAKALGITGVPSLAVNRRWVTSPSMAVGNAAALKVVDHLLQQERR